MCLVVWYALTSPMGESWGKAGGTPQGLSWVPGKGRTRPADSLPTSCASIAPHPPGRRRAGRRRAAIPGHPHGQGVVADEIGSTAPTWQLAGARRVKWANDLEKRGLVRRVRGSSDKREVLAQLTPSGAQLCDAMAATHVNGVRAPSSIRSRESTCPPSPMHSVGCMPSNSRRTRPAPDCRRPIRISVTPGGRRGPRSPMNMASFGPCCRRKLAAKSSESVVMARSPWPRSARAPRCPLG